MLDSLTPLIHYLSTYGYVALFLLILASGTYLPIPAGLILVAVGAFSHQGYFNIFLSFVIALAASVGSDVIAYLIARHLGKNGAYKRYVERNKYAQRIEHYMHTYPKTTIFVSRFIGFISTPVNAIAGLSQVRLQTFLTMDVLSNAISTGAYLGIGYVVGESAEHANFTDLVSFVLIGAAFIYLAGFFIFQSLRD